MLDNLKSYLATWVESSDEPLNEDQYLFFQCDAEDADHAQEQFEDAHPDGILLWIDCEG